MSSGGRIWTRFPDPYNPVAAGLAEHPLAWPWSSARANARLQKPGIRLDQAPLRAALGDQPDWQRRFRAFLEAENGEDPPERAFQVAGGGIWTHFPDHLAHRFTEIRRLGPA